MSKPAGLSAIILLALTTNVVAGDIHDAARDGKLDQVRQLIANDPKLVDSRDFHRSTPLHWAAGNGHKEVMTFLLDHGADPNARNTFGTTPILQVQECRKDLVDFLGARGADVLAKADNGYTLLHWAAARGSQDVAAFLLDKGHGVNVRCEGQLGTPLTMAAANGQIEVAKLLLAKGADINIRTDEGSTPLHDAAYRGHAEMVKLLLDHHAEINAPRKHATKSPSIWEEGGTALHEAVQFGRDEVVGVLIDGGADVNARTAIGSTPLHLASVKDPTAIVKRLLKVGADVSSFNDGGMTPMHTIVLGGDVASVALLLEKGADVNVLTRKSTLEQRTTIKGPGPPLPFANTPLHLATLSDRPDMVILLLSKKADVNARNSLGQTPIRLAKSEAVTKLLREAGGRDE